MDKSMKLLKLINEMLNAKYPNSIRASAGVGNSQSQGWVCAEAE